MPPSEVAPMPSSQILFPGTCVLTTYCQKKKHEVSNHLGDGTTHEMFWNGTVNPNKPGLGCLVMPKGKESTISTGQKRSEAENEQSYHNPFACTNSAFPISCTCI